MRIMKFKITGTKPLLTHNPASISGAQSKGAKRTKISDPEAEAAAGAYTYDGHFLIPATAFRSAILASLVGKKVSVGGHKMSAKAAYRGAIFNVDEYCVLVDPDTGEPLDSYSIDSRRVVIRSTGGSVIRHRPRFEEWGCSLFLEVEDEVIDAQGVVDSLNDAGCRIGVGDFRIEKNGPFGRFTAEIAD